MPGFMRPAHERVLHHQDSSVPLAGTDAYVVLQIASKVAFLRARTIREFDIRDLASEKSLTAFKHVFGVRIAMNEDTLSPAHVLEHAGAGAGADGSSYMHRNC